MRRGRQELAVRAERRRVDGRVEPLEPRADPRAVLERAQERAARVDRVVEAARLEREQEPEVGMLRCDLARLGGEASGLGDGRRVPRASALDEREGSRDQRHHQRGRDGRRAGRADDGRGAARSCSSRVLGVPARLQELAFDAGELPLVARQLDRRRQARPAVEVGVVASRSPPRSEPRSSAAGGCGAPPDPPPAIRAAAATHGSAPRGRSRPSRRPRPGAGRPPAARAPRSPPRRPRPPGSAPPAGPAFGCPPSPRPAR